MDRGIRIARLFGINIYIDWSWIFIFLLVTWNLTGFVFPALHPEWSFGLHLLVGVGASFLFFLSVLLHELAHSLVAKARGLPVRSIILFIFGGVSNIEREPPSPGTEFLVAVVGPLTSILLGIAFLILGGYTAFNSGLPLNNPLFSLRQLDPLTTLLLWLGPINILLGLFNLIPGFPLDGGRVLRSILWALTDNLRTATRLAALVGRAVAWLFIITGIAMAFGLRIPFLGTGFVSGLWLAFIGWFLNSAASQSYRQVLINDVLEGIQVERVMRAGMPTVPPGITIDQLVEDYLMGTDEHAFPVMDNESLVGMVCLDDIRKVPRPEWNNTLVSQVMTPASELEVVSPRQDVMDALNRLTRRDVRQVPVMQGGRLVGMLRRRDIIRWLQIHGDLTASR